MHEFNEATLRKAILDRHGVKATFIRRLRVVECSRDGKPRKLEVLLFQLHGHPKAYQCYAWSADGEVSIVLGVPPIRSAADAVRASMAAND